MNKRWPIFGVMVVFLLGILCGSLATHLFHSYRSDAIIKGKRIPREEMLVNRLEKKLRLDEQQMEQVRTIVHQTRDEIAAQNRQLRPRIEALIDQAHTRISEILTPEQREKFERMIQKRKGRMRDKL